MSLFDWEVVVDARVAASNSSLSSWSRQCIYCSLRGFSVNPPFARSTQPKNEPVRQLNFNFFSFSREDIAMEDFKDLFSPINPDLVRFCEERFAIT
eukprot:5185855-Pleurochrysis_carterae.AAC.1